MDLISSFRSFLLRSIFPVQNLICLFCTQLTVNYCSHNSVQLAFIFYAQITHKFAFIFYVTKLRTNLHIKLLGIFKEVDLSGDTK